MYITDKGYAFVTMADKEGANQAIRELNGTVIDGQKIKVEISRPKRRDVGGGFGSGRRDDRSGGGRQESGMFI